MRSLAKTRLNEILTRCPTRHIGVIGDLGLDAYWYADMTRSFAPLAARYARRVI